MCAWCREVQGATLRHWRWRGILTDYLEAAPAGEPPSPDAPAILLVHGFGAFSGKRVGRGGLWGWLVCRGDALAFLGTVLWGSESPGQVP